jgi:uncharacterized protein
MHGFIDSHVHAYPSHVIDDPVGWADKRRETFWGKHIAQSRIQGWADADRMLRDMDAAGIEIAVLQGWYWEHQATCDEENAWHAQWVREHPDRFVSLASLQPRDGKAAVDGFKAALDAGFHGVGELHPWVQGWSLTSDTWAEIARRSESAGYPVCFHVTEPIGRDYEGRTGTPLEAFVAVAKQFPSLKIVLAHWGGGLPFYELNKWTKKDLTNVYYDTAASPLVYTDKVWRAVTEMAGGGKALFGSDYPLRIYPAKQKEPDFVRLVDEARANLPKECTDAVMGGNARRVYGIPD